MNRNVRHKQRFVNIQYESKEIPPIHEDIIVVEIRHLKMSYSYNLELVVLGENTQYYCEPSGP